jgi:MFS family permease
LLTLELKSEKPLSAARVPSLEKRETAQDAASATSRNLSSGLVDGAAYGAMVGLGETYLPAFVLAAGLGELMAGLVASVPLAAGGLLQLVSPRMVRWLGSHKRWVLCCATMQALSFVPLAWAAWRGAISPVVVLLVASLYWAAGLAAGPAWNTWVGSIVAPTVRARYFALRTRLSQGAVMLGFLAGGFVLHSLDSGGPATLTFAALFAAAGVFRAVSVLALSNQQEPTPMPAAMGHVPLARLARRFFCGDGSRLLVYIVTVQATVQLSGPYFTPFMLRVLRLSYAQYVWLVAAAFAMRVICLPLFGRVAHRYGAARLLWIGGLCIVPLAGMWTVSSSFWWLFAIQLFSGAAWAAYELAFFLLFFESIDESERTSVLTFYNFANTWAWVGGSLVGGAILSGLGLTYESYLILFGLSSTLRIGTLLLLWRVPGVRVSGGTIGVRTLSVRPNSAALDVPILPSLPDRTPSDRQTLDTVAV